MLLPRAIAISWVRIESFLSIGFRLYFLGRFMGFTKICNLNKDI